MSDLASTPEHGGVTDEQMEAFFASHPNLAPLPSIAPEPEPEGQVVAPQEGEPEATPEPAAPEPPPESQPEPPAQPEPEEPSDDFLDLEGTRYPRSQVAAAAQFQQHLVSDPQLQRLITDYLTGSTLIQQEQQQQLQPQPQAPPEDLDMEDPQMRAIFTLIQQQNDQINQLSQGLRVTHEQSVSAQRQQVDAQWKTASTAFAKDHNLEDDEVDRLGQVAARLGVLPQLMQGIDPITGAPSSPDPIRAFQRSLEIAMFQIPEYRDREFKRSVQSMQQESQKRKLLGAVGGTSGSVARTTTPPKPGSNEARKAMLAEVGAMLTGEWSDPTAN